ncbi:hypothetical protein NQ314_014619 [Rhamnusium bicolor]|uniref:Sulfotransferase domain-containing protein n=1 Tax=Rhamnusium bicolor TaxID=1586634 RepID=A0AAV8X0J1_9CUCU|nr:hypothetical protein NQ314_014619 [Rhamnusium bicolor]
MDCCGGSREVETRMKVVKVLIIYVASYFILVMSPTTKFDEDVLNNNKDNNGANKTPFPYTITKVDDETNKELLQCFTGTTWMQEMVWLLANDLNYQKAADIPLVYRFPFLEFSSFVHKETKAEFLKENAYDKEKYEQVQNIDIPAWQILTETTGRRFIKTHLPFSLLPSNILEVGSKASKK